MMSTIFLLIFLLHFLATFPTPNLAQSKELYKNARFIYSWANKFLSNSNDNFDKNELKGWFCATEKTKFKDILKGKTKNGMPEPGNVQIRSDGIYIQVRTDHEIETDRNNNVIVVNPVAFLVPLEMDNFVEYRIVNSPEGEDPSACIDSDHDEYFQDQNKIYKINAPFCQLDNEESTKFVSDGVQYKFNCAKWKNSNNEFWQPKRIPREFAASKYYGIYSISLWENIMNPRAAECSAQTSVEHFYPSPPYYYLVHMDDVEVEDGTERIDCLNAVDPPETTTTTTKSTTTSTTTSTPIQTTTITSKTKWKFQSNRIEFFNGPTPFPPGTVIEMGGWNDKEE